MDEEVQVPEVLTEESDEEEEDETETTGRLSSMEQTTPRTCEEVSSTGIGERIHSELWEKPSEVNFDVGQFENAVDELPAVKPAQCEQVKLDQLLSPIHFEKVIHEFDDQDESQTDLSSMSSFDSSLVSTSPYSSSDDEDEYEDDEGDASSSMYSPSEQSKDLLTSTTPDQDSTPVRQPRHSLVSGFQRSALLLGTPKTMKTNLVKTLSISRCKKIQS